ncbi:MAG TPA: hypothetical protein VFA44_03180 [Gaiellaceae bacterium]|nr:hypothetical protein [Gaiellaceae bacterium]
MDGDPSGWQERDEDGAGWVVVETGRARWRVLLPSPPVKATAARALPAAELFAASRATIDRNNGGPPAPSGGGLLGRFARRLRGRARRRRPGRRRRGWRR